MDNWAKTQAEANIEAFRAAIIDAEIAEVDTPSGTKSVEVAYESDDGFTVREGEVIGVYYEPNKQHPRVIHIDWVDDGRTTIDMDSMEFFEASEYRTE